MWSFMESAKPSVFAATNVEGVERVAKGKGIHYKSFYRKFFFHLLKPPLTFFFLVHQ